LNTNGEVVLAGGKNFRSEVEKGDAWRRTALGKLLANCRLFISANDRKVKTLMPWCESNRGTRYSARQFPILGNFVLYPHRFSRFWEEL
jgi:hypothetical protein